MTDTSGPTSGRQFATYDPDSQSWRMWPDTGLWGSIKFSGTWPRMGCMSDGRAFELPTLAPPHHRERLFILATPTDAAGERVQAGGRLTRDSEQGYPSLVLGGDVLPADAEGERFPGQQQSSRGAKAVAGVDSRFGALPDTGGERCDGRGVTLRQEGRAYEPVNRHSAGIDWGAYAATVRRWERLTRPAPAPTEPNRNGNPRLNAAFSEWMMGLPEGHVTQVPGISRADQLKAIGNGVCPQQAAAALTTLLEKETF